MRFFHFHCINTEHERYAHWVYLCKKCTTGRIFRSRCLYARKSPILLFVFTSLLIFCLVFVCKSTHTFSSWIQSYQNKNFAYNRDFQMRKAYKFLLFSLALCVAKINFMVGVLPRLFSLLNYVSYFLFWAHIQTYATHKHIHHSCVRDARKEILK